LQASSLNWELASHGPIEGINMASQENIVIEVELDPAQLEQVLGEIAELRAEVARLRIELQDVRQNMPPEIWRA
jgi:hypothetical protein